MKLFCLGRVIWQLCGDSSCLLPQPGSTMKTEQLNGKWPPWKPNSSMVSGEHETEQLNGKANMKTEQLKD